jgi:hypothetical protein
VLVPEELAGTMPLHQEKLDLPTSGMSSDFWTRTDGKVPMRLSRKHNKSFSFQLRSTWRVFWQGWIDVPATLSRGEVREASASANRLFPADFQ